jgi:hypothetical protein
MATIKIRKGAVMVEEKDFFSAKHKRLLSLATLAKYLAWGALVFTVFRMGMDFVQFRNEVLQYQAFSGSSAYTGDFFAVLKSDPFYMLDIVARMARSLLNGVVYYVVLKSISLGLNMIVETDINYREKKEKGGAQ